MNRRSFLKKTAIASGAAFAAPYILPSGRLFASTGVRLANHVVFCLFAGGVRNFESVNKGEGNLMPNTIVGAESISSDIATGITSLPTFGSPLQSSGTLFKEFRYKQGSTGHFNAHATAMTGVYNLNDVNLKQPPKHPTVFEYYRKHNSPTQSAMNAWWVSNALGPYPFLNYSKDASYGPNYGANYIQPDSLISYEGNDVLGNPVVFQPGDYDTTGKIKNLLNANFSNTNGLFSNSIKNTPEDRLVLEAFLQNAYQSYLPLGDPWGIGAANYNNDLGNIFLAEKVIEQFNPELLVVNMQDVDVAHVNYTQYCNNMSKADYAIAHLWQTIQNTPGMADDTVLIIAPEHGRNAEPNTIIDQYGRYALDHTNDGMSREIFCMVVGPEGVVNQNQVINAEVGESIDIVPTIAKVLGFYDDIPSYYQNLMGTSLNQAFV